MTDILERVDAEISAGRRWRAKEILRGNLARTWPDPAIVERYGQLLLEAGDRVDAGRYLFLSGVRKPEYEDAIALFLVRHGRGGSRALLAQLPRSVKQAPFGDLPPAVREELSARGVKPNAFGPHNRPAAGPRPVSNAIAAVAGVALVACLVLGIWVGFRAIARWAIEWIR